MIFEMDLNRLTGRFCRLPCADCDAGTTGYRSTGMNVRKAWLFLVLLFFIPTLIAAPLFDRGLLFHLKHPDGGDGYLFATVHSGDERVLNLPREVVEAFNSTQRVAIEIKLEPAAMLLSLSALFFPDGRELRSVVGDSLYAEVVEAFEARGFPEIAVRHFKPWAVATLLSLPPQEGDTFLDEMLYKRAQFQGREVLGLESAEEQLSVFEKMTESEQVDLLRDTLNNLDLMPTMNRELLDAYLARDLGLLYELGNQYFDAEGKPAVQRLQKRILDDRNVIMADRLEKLLGKGSIFAAVGALHLPGEQGMLNLLMQKGFRIEKVY